jgi:hypothetical protein
MDMEGGIALLLLVIIVVVALVLGIALYLTGGALTLRHDVRGGETGSGGRPRFKRVERPEPERVHFAGTPQGERAEREDD